jgi:hypothetical protein
MKNIAIAVAMSAWLVTGAGCATPEPAATVTSCPEPPAVSFTDSSDGMDGDTMDDVAQETDRFGKDLIGMAEEDALQCVEDAGLTWRVYERDGEMFALTMDYRAERVNVKIEKGIVTDAYSG